MKTKAILKIFKDSFSSGDFLGTLKTKGIKPRYRTDDNLSLMEVAFVDDRQDNALNSKERYFVVRNLLQHKGSLDGIGSNAQIKILKGIFTAISEESEKVEAFLFFLKQN
jgi:hypothetical protein